MKQIAPCLWFDNQAEEAVKLYTSIFKKSKVGRILRYGDSGSQVSGRPKGSVMTIAFEINGQEFTALNGGPLFKFTEAISLQVDCESQEEVDEYWAKLSNGGSEGPCGWLKDKFGLSWQIFPTSVVDKMVGDDAGKAERVMKAILEMKKIDIARLRQVASST